MKDVKTAGCGVMTEEEVDQATREVREELKYLLDDEIIIAFHAGLLFHTLTDTDNTYGMLPSEYMKNGIRNHRRSKEPSLTSLLGL